MKAQTMSQKERQDGNAARIGSRGFVRWALVSCVALAVVASTNSAAIDLPSIETTGTDAPDSQEASCTGSPCAAVKCDKTAASAHASGSRYALAEADSPAGHARIPAEWGGTVHAKAAGSPNSARAHAKSWSGVEPEVTCKYPPSTSGTGSAASTPSDLGIGSIGCAIDGSATATGSLLGRLYIDPSGQIAAFDEARSAGLLLSPGEWMFDGRSLEALAPLDVGGMVATGALLSLELVNDAESGTSACNVALA